ncbi:MAG: hypothetical protein ACR2LK_14930 [Solirubrobacteraceae bacterium]
MAAELWRNIRGSLTVSERARTPAEAWASSSTRALLDAARVSA